MKVFVTGATGYVGSHIIKALRQQHHSVTGLVRDTTRSKDKLMPGVHYVAGDIATFENSGIDLVAHDAVVHAAASSGKEWMLASNRFVDQVLTAFAGTSKKLAVQGGSMVFGDTGQRPLNDALGNPYFRNLPGFEEQVKLEKKILGSPAQGVQSFIAYGSLVYGGQGAMIPRILKQTARDLGYSPYIENGTNRWSAVHVEDWADLFVLALEKKEFTGPVMAAANSYSLREVAQIVANANGLAGPKEVPYRGNEELWRFFTLPLATMNQYYQGQRAFNLGWRPKKPTMERYF